MDEIHDDAMPAPTGPDPGAAEAIRCADCARSDSLVTDLDPVEPDADLGRGDGRLP